MREGCRGRTGERGDAVCHQPWDRSLSRMGCWRKGWFTGKSRAASLTEVHKN